MCIFLSDTVNGKNRYTPQTLFLVSNQHSPTQYFNFNDIPAAYPRGLLC